MSTDHEARAREIADEVLQGKFYFPALVPAIAKALEEAAEAEREACAKVAETNWMGMKMYGNPYVEGATDAGGKIAASIRSRTQKEIPE